MKLLLWVETLGKIFIPEVGLEMNSGKALLKKMKNCVKNKETNVLPLGGNVYFPNISDNSIVTNKNVWKFARPFFLNKGSLNNPEIMTRKENKIITDTKEIVQVLNDHYINIVEKSCRKKPT